MEKKYIVTKNELGFAVIDVERIAELKRTPMDFVYQSNGQLLQPIHCSKRLTQKFGELMCIFPFNEKRFSIYKKLNKNEKLGYISRYIITLAHRVGVPKAFIEDYQWNKEKFRIKRLYSKEFLKNVKSNIENLEFCDKIQPLMDGIEKETESFSCGTYLQSNTTTMIDSIIEMYTAKFYGR